MNETLQIIVGLVLLVLVFFLSRFGVAWQVQRSARGILLDLQRRGALSEESAVTVAYEKRNWLNIGLRDFRPQSLQNLLAGGLVVRTEDGRYFLTGAARDALAREQS